MSEYDPNKIKVSFNGVELKPLEPGKPCERCGGRYWLSSDETETVCGACRDMEYIAVTQRLIERRKARLLWAIERARKAQYLRGQPTAEERVLRVVGHAMRLGWVEMTRREEK